MKVSRDSYALLQGGFVMTVELLKQATKRVVGNKQTAKAIQKGTAKTVYIAEDADVRVVQPIIDACSEAQVTIEKVATMQELGKACGIHVGAATAAVLKD